MENNFTFIVLHKFRSSEKFIYPKKLDFNIDYNIFLNV